MPKQRTLKRSIRAVGIGLHTGKRILLTLRPAPPNTGIVFCRTDIAPHKTIRAQAHVVGDTTLATTLIEDDIRVATVEHLLSAFSGLSIDNACVDLDGEEVPIMDGSASRFVFLIEAAGIQEQEAKKKFILIKRPIIIRQGDKQAQFEPFAGAKFSVTVDFPHPVIQQSAQSISIQLSRTSYIKEISRARTFGFLSEIKKLEENKLVLGGSLENALVFDEEKVINENGLRYKDEVVRHKLLDAIGDIYLLGCPIIGSYVGYKAGHALNNLLVRALLANELAWEYTY